MGGCFLYLFSQSVSKILLEPYLDYRKTLGDITGSPYARHTGLKEFIDVDTVVRF